MLEIKSLTQ